MKSEMHHNHSVTDIEPAMMFLAALLLGNLLLASQLLGFIFQIIISARIYERALSLCSVNKRLIPAKGIMLCSRGIIYARHQTSKAVNSNLILWKRIILTGRPLRACACVFGVPLINFTVPVPTSIDFNCCYLSRCTCTYTPNHNAVARQLLTRLTKISLYTIYANIHHIYLPTINTLRSLRKWLYLPQTFPLSPYINVCARVQTY